MTSSRNYLAGNGSPDAAMAIGGATNTTESFNGSSWFAEGNMISNRYRNAAAGTPTAALTWIGGTSSTYGTTSNTTENYNGSSWSSGGSYASIVHDAGGCGVQTAALSYGGIQSDQTTTRKDALIYNGTSWSDINDPVSYMLGPSLFGSTTAGVSAGGRTTGVPVTIGDYRRHVYSYNGSTWTTESGLNYEKAFSGSSGDSTSAILYGGTEDYFDDNSYLSATNRTESWNGTLWSMRDTMTTGRSSHGNTNSSGANAMAFGDNSASSSSEIYN